jgi:hypothetical protein
VLGIASAAPSLLGFSSPGVTFASLAAAAALSPDAPPVRDGCVWPFGPGPAPPVAVTSRFLEGPLCCVRCYAGGPGVEHAVVCSGVGVACVARDLSSNVRARPPTHMDPPPHHHHHHPRIFL